MIVNLVNGGNVLDAAHAADVRYQQLLEGLNCVVLEAERNGRRIGYVSSIIEDVLGYPPDRWYEEVGFFLDHAVHPGDRANVVRAIDELVENGRTEVYCRALRADGATIWLRAIFTLSRDEDAEQPRLHGLMLDVTERLQAEDVLRKSQEQLELALEGAEMGIWDWDVAESAFFWSPQVYTLHGCSKDDVEMNFDGFMRLVDRVHPDDLDRAQSIIQRAIDAGEDYELEYRMRMDDGSYRWLYSRGRIFFDSSGEALRIAGTVQDVTARKIVEQKLKTLNEELELRVQERTADLERLNAELQAEILERIRAERDLERMNEALAQSNRELREFAYVASHDLQEPLRKIMTFSDLLRMDSRDTINESGALYLDRMENSARRMMDLINGLLAYSRVASRGQEFERVDLNDVVADVLVDLEVLMRSVDGTVTMDRLPTIEADPTQMRQLFQNLMGNALKFRRKGVPPVITVRVETAPRGDNNAVCRIVVQDNGIGFEARFAERIFAPFQRLHDQARFEGTGIGLAICRRIIERHGGSIAASGKPGSGATFTVTLPVHQGVPSDGS